SADAEQEMPAIRRPRFGLVRIAVRRFRQPLGRSAVRTLREDAEIALAVRLKRDATAVGEPDGKAVMPAESQSPHLPRAGLLVDPDARLAPLLDAEDDAFAVRRNAGMRVPARRKLEAFDRPGTISEHELASSGYRRQHGGTRRVHERSRLRECKLRKRA